MALSDDDAGPAFGVQLGVTGRAVTTTIAFAGAVLLARDLGSAGYGTPLLATLAVISRESRATVGAVARDAGL